MGCVVDRKTEITKYGLNAKEIKKHRVSCKEATRAFRSEIARLVKLRYKRYGFPQTVRQAVMLRSIHGFSKYIYSVYYKRTKGISEDCLVGRSKARICQFRLGDYVTETKSWYKIQLRNRLNRKMYSGKILGWKNNHSKIDFYTALPKAPAYGVKISIS